MSPRVAPALDLEAQLGALGAEIAALMRPLLAPLLEKLEWVTGDDEQVHELARRWRAMSEALTHVAHDERGALERVDGQWEGLAHTALVEAVVDIRRDLDAVAEGASEVADLLDQAALAVRRCEQLVRDLVRELIEWAAISLALSAAGAIITLGASAAAGAAAAAARAGIVSAQITARLGQLALELRRIEFALGIYQVWAKNLGFVQRRILGAAQGLVVKEVTSLDGNWKPSALSLAQIRLEPEPCFEQPTAGPSW